MESVKLALVLPCYNEEEVLPSSIQRLTLFYDDLVHSGVITPDSRLVFVNDGSKDSSLHVLNEYSSKYPNIKTIDKANGGIASARNAGLAHATGKYVAFCDQDDSLKKGYAKFIQKMESM